MKRGVRSPRAAARAASLSRVHGELGFKLAPWSLPNGLEVLECAKGKVVALKQ